MSSVPLRVAINGLAAKSEGALTYLLNILPQFAALEDGCEFIVYLNEKGAKAVAGRLEEARLRLQIRTMRNTQSAVRRILWEQLKFPKLVQNDSIDVLFVPGPSLPWKCPCPAVIAVRNMEPLDNPEAVATAIVQTLSHHDQAMRRASNARTKVSEWTIDAMAQRYHYLYLKILEENRVCL